MELQVSHSKAQHAQSSCGLITPQVSFVGTSRLCSRCQVQPWHRWLPTTFVLMQVSAYPRSIRLYEVLHLLFRAQSTALGAWTQAGSSDIPVKQHLRQAIVGDTASNGSSGVLERMKLDILSWLNALFSIWFCGVGTHSCIVHSVCRTRFLLGFLVKSLLAPRLL